MTLLEKRWLFSKLVAEFVLELTDMGYEVSFGECYRPPRVAHLYASEDKGISNSLHVDGLAIDLNLFLNGVWLQDSIDYRAAGELWESKSGQNYVCAWGGRFLRPDGCHFSIAHDGRR